MCAYTADGWTFLLNLAVFNMVPPHFDTRPSPLGPGMLGCLHCWHTGQERADERGLAERQPENKLTSLPLSQHRAPSARNEKKKTKKEEKK